MYVPVCMCVCVCVRDFTWNLRHVIKPLMLKRYDSADKLGK